MDDLKLFDLSGDLVVASDVDDVFNIMAGATGEDVRFWYAISGSSIPREVPTDDLVEVHIPGLRTSIVMRASDWIVRCGRGRLAA